MLIETITHQKFEPESLPSVRPEGVVINFNHSQAFSFGGIGMSKFKRNAPPLCACGCEKYTKWCLQRKRWNIFIFGHQNKGKNNPMYGKTDVKSPLYGKKQSREHIKKRNITNPMIGKKHTKESQKKMSKRSAGKNNPMYGNGHRVSGENNGRWKGGISCEPYCDVWLDKDFKESIKERDNHMCQNPDCWENCNHLPLHIHHIDYVKKNCAPQNLITLCTGCNSRANKNREWWQDLYQEIMNEKYNYNFRQ